jgi:hypothetical protein
MFSLRLSEPKSEIVRLNPWIVPFLDDRAGVSAGAMPAAAARARATIGRARLASGASDWNRWALAMLQLRGSVAKSQQWLDVWHFAAALDLGDVGNGPAELNALIIPGALCLRQARFPSGLWASATQFYGPVDAAGAVFAGETNFQRAEFMDVASFEGAVFEGATEFRAAAFAKPTSFAGTRFGGDVWFRGSSFAAVVSFRGATFAGEAGLGNCRYRGGGDFSDIEFHDNAGFDEAEFCAPTTFADSRFHRNAWFADARFEGANRFDRARFLGRVNFANVRIAEPRAEVADMIAAIEKRLVAG